jgi:hypothetical protein
MINSEVIREFDIVKVQLVLRSLAPHRMFSVSKFITRYNEVVQQSPVCNVVEYPLTFECIQTQTNCVILRGIFNGLSGSGIVRLAGREDFPDCDVEEYALRLQYYMQQKGKLGGG